MPSLPEFGVKRPVTNVMIFAGILILAFYSLSRLGLDLFPEIEPPSISVITQYPGASPEDVEAKVSEVLENQLGTTPGLEKITSSSSEGTSVVTLKFLWGTDLDAASNDIRDRIELAKSFLPDIPGEISNPFIFKFNTANFPILFIGITATQTYSELYELIDKRLGDSLRQLPGVGTVQIQGGGLERQINIWIDRQRLEGYGLAVLDIIRVLQRENVTQPVGSIKTGMTDYLIRMPGEFTSPEEMNSVIVGSRGGKNIFLRDVSRVEDSFKEQTMLVRVNRRAALMFMVQKQSGANTVEVTERIKKRLKEVQRTLPRDVNMSIIFDTSKDIQDSIKTLSDSLWFAIVLVILVVWFFLRKLAASMIIALTIPFSLMISFIYLFLAGRTINVISLSSLAIASGMVVDNAIVVVDNIMRRIEAGSRGREAAIFGSNEMSLAIGASTLTTVVVFVPMLFIRGVVGKMFGELAAIVIVTLFASFFTAVTFSPMLSSKWLARPPGKENFSRRKKAFAKFYDFSEGWFRKLEQRYGLILGWCLAHKKTVIFGFLGVFLASLLLVRYVGSEFIPEEDSGDVRITVFLAIGTRVEETDKVAQKIEQIFSEIPEAKFYYVRSGVIPGIGKAFGNASGTHIVTSGGKLVPKSQRKRGVKEVGQIIREKIKRIPGVIKTSVETGNPFSRIVTGGGGKNIQVEIIGNSFETTDMVAERLKGIMEKVPGAVDVSISRDARRPELKVEIDRLKAAALGFSMESISSTVKALIQGASATKYREKGDTYDIYVRLEEAGRSRIEDLENISLVSATTGKQVKLASIARIYESAVPEEIERKNRERVVRVEANAYGRSSGKIVDDFRGELRKTTIPSDVIINLGGEAEEQAKAFRDMAILLALGVILVYMVMAAQFESLLDPFIVMFSIPFTFIGIILGFLITGATLSVISFLGIVMLMGIVVNNAIVLISYINILRARGMLVLEAVTSAGRERLRPVLMTTVTTLVGLLPLAISRGEGSESWQPLGITMISGLTVSTLITMLFVPTLYAVFEARVRKNNHNRKEERRPE